MGTFLVGVISSLAAALIVGVAVHLRSKTNREELKRWFEGKADQLRVAVTRLRLMSLARRSAIAGGVAFLLAAMALGGVMLVRGDERSKLTPSVDPTTTEPDSDYAVALSEVITQLEDELLNDHQLMQSASTSGGQASAASEIADSYQEGADSLNQIEVSPRNQRPATAIADAMTDTSEAYADLARAAAADDSGAYAAASRTVDACERHLRKALAALQSLGYEVSSEDPPFWR